MKKVVIAILFGSLLAVSGGYVAAETQQDIADRIVRLRPFHLA